MIQDDLGSCWAVWDLGQQTIANKEPMRELQERQQWDVWKWLKDVWQFTAITTPCKVKYGKIRWLLRDFSEHFSKTLSLKKLFNKGLSKSTFGLKKLLYDINSKMLLYTEKNFFHYLNDYAFCSVCFTENPNNTILFRLEKFSSNILMTNITSSLKTILIQRLVFAIFLENCSSVHHHE